MADWADKMAREFLTGYVNLAQFEPAIGALADLLRSVAERQHRARLPLPDSVLDQVVFWSGDETPRRPLVLEGELAHGPQCDHHYEECSCGGYTIEELFAQWWAEATRDAPPPPPEAP